MRPASRNSTGEDSGPGRFGAPSPVRRKERRKSIQEKREAVREALMAHQKQMRRDSLQRSESSAVNLLTHGGSSLEPLARLHRPGGEPAIGGSLRFAGSRRAPSRWVCVAADSSPDFVDGLKTLMIERSGWNLPVPTVVMAIAGADREISSLEMGEKAQRVFRRGLLKSARATSAWILTAGLNSGVADLVGRTLYESDAKVPCVGIAPWRRVAYHEEMESRGAGRLYRYGECRDAQRKYVAGELELETHHSHFILVDDDTRRLHAGDRHVSERDTGLPEDSLASPNASPPLSPVGPVEGATAEDERRGSRIHELRAALLDTLCGGEASSPSRDGEGGFTRTAPTPSVMLMVNGRVGALRYVHAHLLKHRPVVVIADSGGAAADIFAYQQTGKLPDKATPHAFGDTKHQVPRAQHFRYCDEARVLLPKIIELGAKPKGANSVPQLSFYSTHDELEKSLEMVVLDAILSDCEKTSDAIMLAVKWRQPSVIHSQLELSSTHDPGGLGRAFEQALVLKNADAVKVLIQYNVDAGRVRLDSLFVDALDRYHIFDELADSDFAKARQHWTETVALAPVRVLRWVLGQLRAALPDRRRTSDASSGASRGESSGSAAPEESTQRRHAGAQSGRGFQILRDLEGVVGYGTYLSAREALLPSGLRPEWLDLMMWAVLVGEPEIARHLWTKVTQPLRAALLATRVCRMLVAGMRDSGATTFAEEQSLEADAMMYESWATGLLDEIDEKGAAAALLTSVPSVTLPPAAAEAAAVRPTRPRGASFVGPVADGASAPEIAMWPGSPMDEAVKSDYPAMSVVAHPHCQSLLDRFFAGDYDGSLAKIDEDAGLARIGLQLIPPFNLFTAITNVKPLRGARERANEREAAEGDGALATSNYYSIRALLDLDVDSDGEEDNPDNPGRSASQRSTQTEPQRQETGAATARSMARRQRDDKRLARRLPRQLSFFSVPKVKYVVHTVSAMLYALLLTYVLLGWPWEGKTWMWRRGELGPVSMAEAIFWAWALCRVLEEAKQMVLIGYSGYISSFWNQMDLLTSIAVIGVAVMRMATELGRALNGYITSQTVQQILAVLGRDGAYYSFDDDQAAEANEWSRNLYAVVVLLVYLRFFDLLTYSPRLGVLTIIIKRMMDDVLSWAAVVGCVTLGVSMAFAVLMPADNSRPEFLLKPFFLPFWGLVGEVDVERFFDHFASGGDDMPTELLLPFLLFIYSFFATVVFVNLLIAQMSSTYEQVRENSERFWVFDRVTLIAEYKDNRDPFPPPFNALYILGYDVPKMLIHFAKRLCRQQVSKLYFGHARRGFSTLNSLRVASGLQQDERWHLRQYLEKHELREKAKVEQQLVDLQRGQTTLEAEQRSQFDSLNSKINNNAARMWRELDDLRASLLAGGGVVRSSPPPAARRPPSPPPGGPPAAAVLPSPASAVAGSPYPFYAAQSRLPPMAPIRSVSSGADETAGEESSPPGIFSRLRRGSTTAGPGGSPPLGRFDA